MSDDLDQARLNLTLCHDKCRSDCKSYITPIGVCFSSRELFPNDPSWSDGWDIRDDPIQPASFTFHRTIFHTKNKTCSGNVSDIFDIPLDVCVGPFGKPRPWGTFQLVAFVEEDNLSVASDNVATQ